MITVALAVAWFAALGIVVIARTDYGSTTLRR
jgi:hypothetical protein